MSRVLVETGKSRNVGVKSTQNCSKIYLRPLSPPSGQLLQNDRDRYTRRCEKAFGGYVVEVKRSTNAPLSKVKRKLQYMKFKINCTLVIQFIQQIVTYVTNISDVKLA